MGVGWLLMPLLWVVLIGLIVWAVVRLTADRGEHGQDRQGGQTPLDILDHRFARGEIDADAYQQARAILAQHGQGPR
jgi:putative membrane protein